MNPRSAKRTAAFVLGLVPAFFALPALGAQQSDTTPPVLITYSFSPSAVDVTAGPVAVTGILQATDDIAGFDIANIRFRSPSGRQINTIVFSAAPVTGTRLDGTYSGEMTVHPFVESGTWTVEFVYLQDQLGNARTLVPSDLPVGLPTTLEVTSDADATAPLLVTFDFSPRDVDVTTGPATIGGTLEATDDKSGFDIANVRFRSPSGQQIGHIVFSTPPTTGDRLRGTFEGGMTVAQFTESGTWTLEFVYLQDRIGNARIIPLADLPAGVPTTFTVTSVTDRTPPALIRFDYSPKTVDISNGPATVMGTLDATDDISGFGSADLRFRSPSGQRINDIVFTTQTSGDRLGGTYRGESSFAEFSESGTWTVEFLYLQDQIGNNQTISRAELVARGLPTTLQVIDCHALSLAVNPTTVARGGSVTLTAMLKNCSSATQTVRLTFMAETPCTRSLIATTPQFTLQPGVSRSASIPFRVPRVACTGPYKLTVTASAGDVRIGTASASLTVMP